MKLAITTRSDKNIKAMTDVSHPVIQDYSDRIGADFIVLDSNEGIVMSDDRHPHFRIMHLRKLLDIYDRILNLDSDIIINKTCPNIFDVVPEDKIGTVFEDKGTREKDRRRHIRSIQRRYGDVGWTSGYINTGVFVVSKQHANIFDSVNGEFWTAWGSDDVHLGYKIREKGHEIHEFDFKYNHMTMFSEQWNGKANRFDSHIIHYAGSGIFDKSAGSRVNQMKLDKEKIYG